MKTNFQQYNSKSDEELIELSMGNSVDASMSRTVLEYRKYLEAKRQNQLSFRLARLVAILSLAQLTIAFFNFWLSNPVIHLASPTATSTPIPTATFTMTSIPTASPIPQPSLSPTLPYVGTAILQSDVTVAATDDNGVEILVTLTAGTRVIVLSKDTRPEMCNALIHIRYETDYGSIEVTESIPMAMIGETC